MRSTGTNWVELDWSLLILGLLQESSKLQLSMCQHFVIFLISNHASVAQNPKVRSILCSILQSLPQIWQYLFVDLGILKPSDLQLLVWNCKHFVIATNFQSNLGSLKPTGEKDGVRSVLGSPVVSSIVQVLLIRVLQAQQYGPTGSGSLDHPRMGSGKWEGYWIWMWLQGLAI